MVVISSPDDPLLADLCKSFTRQVCKPYGVRNASLKVTQIRLLSKDCTRIVVGEKFTMANSLSSLVFLL